MKKLIFALVLVAALLVVALPAFAQGPVTILTTDQGKKPIYVVKAGTNEDPFGGLPIQTSSGLGSASKYGIGGPGVFLRQGGVPSNKSGDATSPRKSVYVGGAWQLSDDVHRELPTCATVKVPAGTSRWFKMDTWKDKKLQVWLDDEKNDATAPSGSAVFGAADAYMAGLNPGSAWIAKAYSDQWGSTAFNTYAGPFTEGFVMAILDPNNMRPNYAYEAPNAALYTVGTSASGSPYRSGQGVGDRVSVTGIIGETNVHGYATFNPTQPGHLLWFEGRFDGWVHARVYNQMIWDGVVSVCTYRAD